MKKFFLFLSAALVSMVMQATIVTKSVDWTLEAKGSSSISGNVISAKSWSGAEKWSWLTGASQYDQLVLEVADHTENIQFKAIFNDGTADVSPASVRVLPAGFNEIAVDVTADVLHYIEVLNASETDDVEITINRIYLRGAVGETEEIFPWQGSKSFDDWDWNQRVLIAPEKFNDLHVGDIVELAYTTNAESYHQIQIKFEYDNTYPKFSPFQIDLGGSSESGVLRFCITNEDDLTDIASKGGIYLNGKFITFTQLSVIKHKLLWTGIQSIGEWDDQNIISASKLSNLEIGDILCVRLTSLTIGGESGKEGQVNLQDGDWHNFSPNVTYLFKEGDAASEEVPFLVEFPVTYKMHKQLQGKDLIVKGVNYTMTDIYVMEGVPTEPVSETLTVTDAKMATYILPFDVLSLPEGVQAYTLTNDGSDAIMATAVNALEEDKPVLIIAEAGPYTFTSAAGDSKDVSYKTGTYTNGALIGTYNAIDQLEQTTGGNYNYILQNGGDGVAFYQVLDANCNVPAYRAYLSCGFNASTNGSAPKRMRLVFQQEEVATGMESVEPSTISSQKVLRNGQLLIIRDTKTYNTLGQLVD